MKLMVTILVIMRLKTLKLNLDFTVWHVVKLLTAWFLGKKNENQPRWFLNLKSSLTHHILMVQHYQRVATCEVLNNLKLNSVQQVKKICSNILYYMIKTNSPAAMYPVLLAVIFRSGYQVGNNHSSYTFLNMLEQIDMVLREENIKWFNEHRGVYFPCSF